jgi:hypothetical protein
VRAWGYAALGGVALGARERELFYGSDPPWVGDKFQKLALPPRRGLLNGMKHPHSFRSSGNYAKGALYGHLRE